MKKKSNDRKFKFALKVALIPMALMILYFVASIIYAKLFT